jgi:hypothetical protein
MQINPGGPRIVSQLCAACAKRRPYLAASAAAPCDGRNKAGKVCASTRFVDESRIDPSRYLCVLERCTECAHVRPIAGSLRLLSAQTFEGGDQCSSCAGHHWIGEVGDLPGEPRITADLAASPTADNAPAASPHPPAPVPSIGKPAIVQPDMTAGRRAAIP